MQFFSTPLSDEIVIVQNSGKAWQVLCCGQNSLAYSDNNLHNS